MENFVIRQSMDVVTACSIGAHLTEYRIVMTGNLEEYKAHVRILEHEPVYNAQQLDNCMRPRACVCVFPRNGNMLNTPNGHSIG